MLAKPNNVSGMPQTNVRAFRCDLSSLVSALETVDVITWDWETVGNMATNAIPVGLGVYLPTRNEAWYINVGHLVSHSKIPRQTTASVCAAIQPYFGNSKKLAIGHNAQFDMIVNERIGVDQRCQFSDSMITVHRTNENMARLGELIERAQFRGDTEDGIGYGLKAQVLVHFNEKAVTYEEATDGDASTADPAQVAGYCVNDCVNTWRLQTLARKSIDNDPIMEGLLKMDDENVYIIFKMMSKGIPVSIAEAERQAVILGDLYNKTNEEIWKRFGRPRDISTRSRVLEILKELKCEPYRNSLKREVLIEEIEKSSDKCLCEILALLIVRDIINQRLTRFVRPSLDRHINKDKERIFLSAFRPLTATTRFTCTPNFQALPKKADKISGRDVIWRDQLPDKLFDMIPRARRIITAPAGRVIIAADLSSAEPRYAAQKMQNSLVDRGKRIEALRKEARLRLQLRYDDLLKWREASKIRIPKIPDPIVYPSLVQDPLFSDFIKGVDPYAPMGITLGISRDTAKTVWLATSYMTSAESLAKRLSITETEAAGIITRLEQSYPMLPVIREEVRAEIFSAGMVRTLFNRPRRIAGLYHIIQEPECCITMLRGGIWYKADVIFLGFLKWGLSCFIKKCWRMDDREIVLQADRASRKYDANWRDPLVRADHYVSPPFRNLSYKNIRSVTMPNGIIYPLPEIERAIRQGFNAQFQGTGADHLRWIMNRLDREVLTQPQYKDFSLILNVHDELVFDGPRNKEVVTSFRADLLRVMESKPEWAALPIKAEMSVGANYGEMTKLEEFFL